MHALGGRVRGQPLHVLWLLCGVIVVVQELVLVTLGAVRRRSW